jgi:hypothetical protein
LGVIGQISRADYKIDVTLFTGYSLDCKIFVQFVVFWTDVLGSSGVCDKSPFRANTKKHDIPTELYYSVLWLKGGNISPAT